MDDVVLNINYITEWSIGPSKVWVEAITNNIITPLGADLYLQGRGMVWGKYL